MQTFKRSGGVKFNNRPQTPKATQIREEASRATGSWQTPAPQRGEFAPTPISVNSGRGVSVGDVHKSGEFSSSAEFLSVHPI